MARNEYNDQTWGAGIIGRIDSIPYHDSVVQDSTVSNFVPLFYYENDYVYLRGTTYGLKLYGQDDWQLSLLSRIRLLSIPEEYQNKVQGDSLDYGARFRYFQQDNIYIDLELMQNSKDGNLVNLRYSADLVYGDAYFSPYATLTYKESAFNSSYYGRDIETIDPDVGATLGFELKYQVYSNFYLLGGLSGTYVGSATSDSEIIDQAFTYSAYAGIGILNDKHKPFVEVEGMKPYIRLAHGWATISSLEDILTGGVIEDEHNNRMTSIFYGHPVSNNLFDLPLQVYLTPGLTYHHESDVQEATWEADLAFKFYYTLPIDAFDFRLGAGEGFSYIDSVTYIENLDANPKGYTTSHLNFYLDLSADLGLGFIGDSFQDLWIGAAVHHRSSVFEQSSLFGRIKGGSNYNTVYLQWHF
jgi:outer membrane protein